MRIDKYLANMNVGSRKEVHVLIKKGIVTVNGDVVKTPKQQVKESDEVLVDGQEVNYQKYHYFLMNKPKGVLSATEDRSQRTVISLLKLQDQYQGITPVGRLDKDTTGLLLLTNDGQLNHELLAPNKHVDKIYRAKIAGVADDETVKTFASGMTLGDGTKLKPAELKILAQDEEHDSSEIEIKIREGKYHQIKRMFGAVGMKVVELERISMGKLKLPKDLKRGNYIELSLDDVSKIK
ncbi:Ribosomal large subunit pseudouridine synthase B [Lactobacillus helveticus]|uniref:Pseudouridine synthase n=1 Tax=Lactobacillus helveticus TaxID=1587 RepID=A0A9Q5C5K1_LACHE|nr:pseudouridine synthase [Lactobacillus helveticus]NRN78601.1 Ribosomal large subunit pseudouridine synthase B [Lactobacillus helveticus]NRN91360.1 Ribosomal large subunit pseudouridine synthase B [Lactobacillus helveticus]NRN95548.1 Ribosomal large subunit pseudouridine synthase B [Lactobacillus helveticus]NRO14301.1 Ribosomal large subunit pseudouridine synthase B [Lactobacillus helveticus]NRO52220.1 Ribosomal large subunit pseudouridine synthase B [Lactobacillus helveticus]